MGIFDQEVKDKKNDVTPDIKDKKNKVEDKARKEHDDATLNAYFNALNDGVDLKNFKPVVEKKEENPPESNDNGDLKKELANVKKVLANYQPYINELNKNPDFLKQSAQLLEGNYKRDVDLFEQLGIDKDEFMFNADEAVKDDKSDSAKLLNAKLAGIITKVVNDRVATTERQRNIVDQRNKAMQNLKLTEEDVSNIDEFANNHSLTYEDVALLYQLKNGSLPMEIRKKAKTDILDQVRNAHKNSSGSYKSPASVGSEKFDEDFDFAEAVIRHMEGNEKGIFS